LASPSASSSHAVADAKKVDRRSVPVSAPAKIPDTRFDNTALGGQLMKPLLIASIILIVLGVVALTYQGITYTTTEQAFDFGPLHITAERTHTIPMAPILGVVALAGGAALFFVSRRKN
jgi:LPXTG-motif cell wall-anchored protein